MAQHEDHAAKRTTRLAAQQEKVFQLNVDEAFEALLQTAKGRDFLWWLLEHTGVNRNPFGLDPISTAYNCGTLEVGRIIQDRALTVNAEAYLTMSKERKDGRRHNTSPDAGTDGSDSDSADDSGAD